MIVIRIRCLEDVVESIFTTQLQRDGYEYVIITKKLDTDKTYIEDTNDGYEIIGRSLSSSSTSSTSSTSTERNRSPSDPLPHPNDIPGYLKTDFQRYKIFKPNDKDVDDEI